MKKTAFESGRSMVEMLGTLAIIGVLSIGGIAGYSYGMDKHRANQTMSDINLRIIDLMAQTNKGSDLSLSEWPTKTTSGYDIFLEKNVNTAENTGGIEISNVPNRVCELLGEMAEHSNVTIKITGTEYTKGFCGEKNTMVFFQEEVVNSINKTPPCNGPIVDGKCEPCKSPYVWDSTACTCPPEYPYDKGEMCAKTENGPYSEATSLCPEGQIYVRTGNQPYGCKEIGWCEAQGGTYISGEFWNCDGLHDGPE